jgi:hypothetical protein
MRLLLNILAWVILLAAGIVAVGCVALFGTVGLEYLKENPRFPDIWPGISILLFSFGMAFLGSLFGWRALAHLRQPNAGTASDVITLAIYLLALAGGFPLFRRWPVVAFTLLLVLYFLRQYLIKRLAARAFPAGAPPRHADSNFRNLNSSSRPRA